MRCLLYILSICLFISCEHKQDKTINQKVVIDSFSNNNILLNTENAKHVKENENVDFVGENFYPSISYLYEIVPIPNDKLDAEKQKNSFLEHAKQEKYINGNNTAFLNWLLQSFNTKIHDEKSDFSLKWKYIPTWEKISPSLTSTSYQIVNTKDFKGIENLSTSFDSIEYHNKVWFIIKNWMNPIQIKKKISDSLSIVVTNHTVYFEKSGFYQCVFISAGVLRTNVGKLRHASIQGVYLNNENITILQNSQDHTSLFEINTKTGLVKNHKSIVYGGDEAWWTEYLNKPPYIKVL